MANIKFIERLKKYITKNPDRIWMDGYLVRLKKKDIRPGKLACGTVGCIAGDALVLAYGARKAMNVYLNGDVDETAALLMGLSRSTADQLFYFSMRQEEGGPWDALRNKLNKHAAGTKGYAKVVCEAIDYAVELE